MGRATHTVQLQVKSADAADVYRDIARVPPAGRGQLKTGRLYRFAWSGGSQYLVLRGLDPSEGLVVKIDSESRHRLGIASNQAAPIAFTIQEADFWGELAWAWQATDPAYRVAAKLGIWGLALGLLGLVAGVGFGIVSLFH